MAEVAIELDCYWRVLEGQNKPLTLRGARLARRNLRRARGDRCHEHVRGGEGRRAPAFAHATCRDVEQQLGDPVSGYDELDEEAQPVSDVFDLEAFKERRRRKTLSKAVRAHQRRIRRADLLELEAEGMIELEAELRHAREEVLDIYAQRRFLRDFIPFLEKQLRGADRKIVLLIIALRLELCELDVLMKY